MDDIFVDAEFQEYKGKRVEKFRNMSVAQALNYVVKQQMKKTNDIDVCKNEIMKIFDSLPVLSQQKSHTMFPTILVRYSNMIDDKNKKHVIKNVINFMNYVKEQEELIYAYKVKPENDIFERVKDILGFGFVEKNFSNDERKPSECFQSPIIVYNEVVNFEHVCFIMAIILMDEISLENDQDNINFFTQAFLYFLNKFINNVATMKFVVYHLFKLIRVYFVNSLRKRADNMFLLFAGLSFNVNFNDPSIEFYGDVRINNQGTAMDNFMMFPRCEIYTKKQNVLWFNNNTCGAIVGILTNRANEVLELLASGQFKKFRNLECLAGYMTEQDIRIRSALKIKGLCMKYVHTTVEKGFENAELRNYIIDFFKKNGKRPSRKEMEMYKDYKIGFTFKNENGKVIANIIKDLTFGDIFSSEADGTYDHVKIKEFIAKYDYVQEKRGKMTYSKIGRILYRPEDKEYPELAPIVESYEAWEYQSVDPNNFFNK